MQTATTSNIMRLLHRELLPVNCTESYSRFTEWLPACCSSSLE